MYIWIGIDCEKGLESIRDDVKRVDDIIQFDHSMFSLPYHISLKITFEADKIKYKLIKKDVIKYFKTKSSFDIDVKGIEKHDNIVWLRMINNDIIDNIHQDINNLLKDKYDISLHEYDLDFIFHTTLYMNDDIDKISKAYDLIKDIKVPSKLHLDTFLIGKSTGGNLGSFRIAKRIKRK